MAYILLVAQKEDDEVKAAEDVLEEHHGYDIHLAGRDVQLKEASDADYAAAILLSSASKMKKDKKLQKLLARMHGEGKPVAAVGKAAKLFPVAGLIMAPDADAVKRLCETVLDALEGPSEQRAEERHKEGSGRHGKKKGKSIPG